ncbi:acyl carrier protein [Scytonema sp. NUACC26]|uniref:acyl carrier protein n=1 Tax=Scytonema sp. NUACC26 TaxID=3140176 RepID=UPI0034DC58CC
MKIQNVEAKEILTISPRQDVQQQQLTIKKIQTWLVSRLAEQLEIDSNKIDVAIPFERYGVDSLIAISLTGDLEQWLGCELDPTLLYDYPTVKALAQHLFEECVVKV